MWPFTKRKIQKVEAITEQPSIKISDDPSISCLVKGIGVMIESKEYKWTNMSNIFSSSFRCELEDVTILMDYNIFSKKYKITSPIFTSQGGLKEQENNYLIEKLTSRFSDTVVQKRKNEEDMEQQKLNKISNLGCPKKNLK